ncbi:TetR/AcrR family transcriptional regulator, partial [Mycobacterium tuberculosis]|nr:TetR/AcrR family transcriptional regulator [Mycobacterium tuberculosis]
HARYGAVRALDFDVLYALWLGPAQEYSRQWLGAAVPVAPTEIADELAAAAWQVLAGQAHPTQEGTR